MSYLALARKWRPRFFRDVAGQDHVIRALLNGVESGRLHHAFLLTGTRGVGKTTIARLLAKVLNCENPAEGEPCGECSPCVSIDEGRFVDLLEVDAASNTKVDQTRELLENVQYSPSAGRYKIYLIDEVHMLSGASFNALLKTLEEPPPHVKFVLATTDPQKIPVTVLSRCLQFNLKRLPARLIAERMTEICSAEGIDFEPAAMLRLGRAADGSVRDGLSLLDQALAFGGGRLQDADVAEMLGSVDSAQTTELLRLVSAGDAAGLIASVRRLHEYAPDFEALLAELAVLLQHIAVVQMAGADALDADTGETHVEDFAAAIDPETVQLFYQIAITAKRDLALAPDPLVGFEMALLRMLAFAPADSHAGDSDNDSAPTRSAGRKAAQRRAPVARSRRSPAVDPTASWTEMLAGLDLSGATLEAARHCELVGFSTDAVQLRVSRADSVLLTPALRTRLTEALQQANGADLQVIFDVVDAPVSSVAGEEKQRTDQQEDAAVAAIRNDPNVGAIIDTFDARLDEDSVRSVRRPAGRSG